MSAPLTLPRVSVVMSVRNAERFVAQAVESILTQTMSDLEFIVVDNASSDRTPEILSTFAQGTRGSGSTEPTPTWGWPRP